MTGSYEHSMTSDSRCVRDPNANPANCQIDPALNWQEWQAAATKQIGDGQSDPLHWVTPEGIEIKRLYTREDLAALSDLDGVPGFAPFVRGPYASMYAGRPWTVRQYAGLSTAADSNAFYRRLLQGGAQGISVAFDLPTQRGFDSDHADVAGDVGKAGVAIDSVEDMKVLFEGIPLDRTSVSMTINGAVLPILAGLIVAAEEQGVDARGLSGTVQNDVLKEFLVRNTYIYPPKPSLRIVGDVMAYCAKNLPKFNSISVSGYHMHEAGADAALELAYTLADGREYLSTAVDRGIDVDQCAPRMSFFFGIGMNFLMEIAKLRAARLVWSRLVEPFKPKNPRSKMLRMHCQTSGWSLTQQDPYNNIVRTTIEAMAGVFGGTQSLHTNAFDEALALPSDLSARVARNTQLILQEETGLCNVIDPWGGSYLMENLTHSIAASATELIEEIERLGGMTRAIELGIPKMRIDEAAAARQARIDSGQETIVGVNKYATQDESEIEILRIDNQAVRDAQHERLVQLKSQRDSERVEQMLTALRQAAATPDQNLLDVMVDAIRARATLGEVSSALEDVFQRYEVPPINVSSAYGEARVDDSDWNLLHEEVEEWTEQWGHRPRMLICKLGQDGHDRGLRVVAAALSDLGFDVQLAPMFMTPEKAADKAVELEAHVIGVSTQAGAHLTLIPELQRCLSSRAVDLPIVAGGVIPAADRDQLIKGGIRSVFGPGTPIHQIARELLPIIQQRQTSTAE